MNKLKEWVNTLERVEDELFRRDSKIPPHLKWKIGLAYVGSMSAFLFALGTSISIRSQNLRIVYQVQERHFQVQAQSGSYWGFHRYSFRIQCPCAVLCRPY